MVSWLLGLVFLSNNEFHGLWVDLNNYLACGKGDCGEYYYGYWFLPVFSLLAELPENVTNILWGLLNITGVWFSARVFGGNKFIALISYPMLSVLWYGQITGLILAGVAITLYGIIKRNWFIAGMGLVLALVKYNIAIIFVIPILLGIKLNIKEWAQIVIWPLSLFCLSILIHSNWILKILDVIQHHPPLSSYSLSIWPYTGAISLLLFIPLIGLPKQLKILFIGWVIAGSIGLPYFQLKEILALLIMPIPIWITLIIGFIGFMNFFVGARITQIYIIISLGLYVYFLWQIYFQQKKYVSMRSIRGFNKFLHNIKIIFLTLSHFRNHNLSGWK